MPVFKGKRKMKCPVCNGWGRPRIPCKKTGKHNYGCKRCLGHPKGFVGCNHAGLLIGWCDFCSGSGWIKKKRKSTRKTRNWRRR